MKSIDSIVQGSLPNHGNNLHSRRTACRNLLQQSARLILPSLRMEHLAMSGGPAENARACAEVDTDALRTEAKGRGRLSCEDCLHKAGACTMGFPEYKRLGNRAATICGTYSPPNWF
jgi:hypothetical protein